MITNFELDISTNFLLGILRLWKELYGQNIQSSISITK